MNTFFRRTKLTECEQPLLTNTELQALRASAEQIETHLTPIHEITSKQIGWLPSNSLGSGMDYADSRMYQLGDDPRYINWRLSARTQETFVKTFHTEARPCLCILFDRRRSMLFGTRRRLKITQAYRAAIMLAYASELHHIDLHTLIVDDKIRYWDDQSADTFILQTNKIQKPTSITDQSTLKLALRDIRQHVPQGSLVYLISDFFDLDDTQQAELAQLQENYTVQAIHVLDPAELDLSYLGKVSLQSMQTHRKYTLNTEKKHEQQNYAHFAKNHAEQIKNRITDRGLAYIRLLTDESDIHPLISLPLGHN